MAFIITKDFMPDLDEPEGTNLNARGVTGPSTVLPDKENSLQLGVGRKFRMFDDDGELYYEGLFIDDCEAERYEGEPEFQPLDCFGAPNAGAVRIDYLVDGQWVQL